MQVSQVNDNFLHLVLLPTEDCNLRCPYCYENFAHKEMKSWVLGAILAFLRRRIPSLKRLSLGWFGGEPLLAAPLLLRLSEEILSLCNAYGVKLVQHITTNGVFLSEELVDQLFEREVRHFQITLDGPEPYHDAKRRGPFWPRTFGIIWENLQRMKRRKDAFTVAIRINVDLENIEAIPSLLGELGHVFAGDERFLVHFHRVGRWGGANDDSIQVLPRKVSLSPLYAEAKKLGLRTDLDEPPRQGGYVCYAAWPNSFVIRADGRVNKCTVALEAPENQVGRLLPDGSLALDKEKLLLWLTANGLEDRVCQSCSLFSSCQGAACPWERLKNRRRPCPEAKRVFAEV